MGMSQSGQSFAERIRPWQCAACGAANISANKQVCPQCGPSLSPCLALPLGAFHLVALHGARDVEMEERPVTPDGRLLFKPV